ncbi:tetratricopeptide repeat protein [Paenibacillus sp. SYP-B3998]|uniref:Tetratricopeptide repeat protein n=1 Tax=Paenibacillus sp. SYP-B3998 TaxID=2678564 RepID=A0A6G3ZU76_9BACL|nr:SAM-dependent methyltransferase [Paenibacillus sp. SYP-B3998]NEW05763.1 tetratricopeptide repeat protein [Paenibacillus sp. SYP-B3998]
MTHKEQQIYRFSEAPIWELQRSYYEEQGIHAWQSEEVPQYITSNPIIAVAYAEIIFGFLQDRARLGYSAEPITIVELGAGSGRLAFHILKELCELRDYAGISLPSFRYVMSDLAVKNIAYWEQHRSLLPFVQQGVLDFAQFDAAQDTELHLTQTNVRIGPSDLKQPLLVIANYFFDSIPQELLYVDENKIYECDVSLEFPVENEELRTSDKLKQVIPHYHYRRAAAYEQETYPYYHIIEVYKQKLEDSHVLFPAVGLDCLERLSRLSNSGFLLLTADKGDHRLDNWEYSDAPKLIHHGSFSLTANYHAIQHVFEQKGAETLFTKHHYNHLNVGCILMLQIPKAYANTRLAYRRFVDHFGPDDFFSIKEWFDKHLIQMEFTQLHAFWRLSGYDAQVFLQSAKRISDLLSTCGDEEMNDLRKGIYFMWKGFYPMEEKHVLALDCGTLLYQMDLFEDALVFYKRYLQVCEGDTDLFYQMAICCYELSIEDAAMDYSLRALALEPEHDGALALVELVKSNED